MLFGKDSIQEIIINKVKEIEKDRNIKVVFGAMVGSISKEIGRYDSDYDTRFLYLEPGVDYIRNGIENIREEEVHFSYVPDEKDLFFDKIAFWELTSFLSYLVKPVLDGKESNGLYHLVNWTFASPYVWDPYGLSNKLMPFINILFEKKYEIGYLLEFVKFRMNQKPLELRYYLYSAYYCVAMEWIKKYNAHAPVSYLCLYAWTNDEELQSTIKKCEDDYYKSVYLLLERGIPFSRKMANVIPAKRYKYLDEYISRCIDNMELLYLDDQQKVNNSHEEINKMNMLNKMMEIVYGSLKREVIYEVND